MKSYVNVVNVNVENLANIKIALGIANKIANIRQAILNLMGIYVMQSIYVIMNVG
jgi:hypothetical protein